MDCSPVQSIINTLKVNLKISKGRKMKEKGDKKFFTNLEKYGNIKPVLKLQF
jgi:hypothetical protein